MNESNWYELQPPPLLCSDAGLSDAGADDDGQKGQELVGVERMRMAF